jgi:sirohydrochlorin ferrochelatase
MADRSQQGDLVPDVGWLLVGHGSREAAGVEEFLAAARLVGELAAPWIVEPCFLEFAEPAIAAGFDRLVARGARQVVVAPVMLFAAAHIRRDIPAAVAQAAARYPGLPVRQAEHLGDHPAIVELSKSRFDAALAARQPVRAEETILVLVGRGSHDERATEEMLQFAQVRRAQSPGLRVETGFVAMAHPPYENVLEQAGESRAARIVVQPHLLFGGLLLERIAAAVERMARRFSRQEWIVAEHLGPSELVARAIADRARWASADSIARTPGDACTA